MINLKLINPVRLIALCIAAIIISFALMNCTAQKGAQKQTHETNQTADNKNQKQGTTKSTKKVKGEYKVHIVQNGESLSVIAQQYGVTVDELCKLNNITDADLIRIGQELIIFK